MDKALALGVVIGGTVAPSIGNAFQTVESQAQASRNKLKKLKLGEALIGNIDKYRTELVALQAAEMDGVLTAEESARQIGAVKLQYERARDKAREYGIDVGNLAGEQKRLGFAVEQANKALERQDAGIRNKRRRGEIRGQAMDVVGMAFAAAAPIRAAMDYETTMAEIRKVVDFDTPQQFQTMSNDILRLSTVMPMAASGIGDIVAAAGQSGIARDELMDFAKSAVTMGVAFDLTGEQAGSMMANWRAGMNLTQERAVGLADAVNHLSNNMNAQAGALGEVLQRQGAVAMAAGLTEVQTASLGAALLSSGTGPERAATALKNLTGALTKGYAATKAQQEAFASLGLDAEEMAVKMQTNAKGAIVDVFEALQQASAEERGALVSQLFGEESKGAIMPLLSNLENLRKAFNLTADQSEYAASMQKEYEERAKTSANNLQLLRNQLSRTGVTLGSALLPALNDSFGVIGSLAGGVADLAEKFPGLTKFIVGAGTSLVAFKLLALGGSYGLTLISDALLFGKGVLNFFTPSVLRANFALVAQRTAIVGAAIAARASAVATGVATAAQWAWNVAMSANPIGLIVAGVGALIAGGIWLYKTFDPVRAVIDKIWVGFKKLIEWSPLGLLIKVGQLAGTLFNNDDDSVKRKIGRTVSARTRSTSPDQADEVLPRVAPATRNNIIHSNPKIEIHQAPGQSTEDVAAVVRRELMASEQRMAAQQRGRLYD